MPERADKEAGPLLLEVERFEHVSTGAERVLLRIDGRYGDRPGKRVLDAMLFVDDGLAVHRHAPLEDDASGVDSWLWRAAFDIPASYLTDERTRFALESQPGCLVDLPRPADLVRGSAIPITARAAHIARRYAAAVAVLLAVAVTPGGLPASARTEILRIHKPDGSVVLVTPDGSPVAEIPAGATVIDQQQPAPAPEPQPAPQPQPDPQPAPPKMEPADRGDKKSPLAESIAQQNASGNSTGGGGKSTKAPRHGSRRHHDGTKDSSPAQDGAAPAAGSAQGNGTGAGQTGRRHHRGPRPHSHQTVRAPQQAPAPPADPGAQQGLQAMPALLASPGSDDAQLKSIGRGATASQSLTPAASGEPAPPIPTKDLETLPNLGATATGPTPAPPMTMPQDAPPLLPITPGDSPTAPETTGGDEQQHSGDHRHAQRDGKKGDKGRKDQPTHHHTGGQQAPSSRPSAPLRHSDGTPTRSNPTFFDALPGPTRPGAVPDFVIEKFRVPPFLLPIYQAAGIQYGIRWEVLAAINEIETDYGRNLNVSSAGALGWMQFMPATWKMYGTDANRDKKADPFNPVDAIFSAARYLKAAGGDKDIRRAIFAYNHAGWYVDSVMLRARLIAGYPADLVGSLTGLTEGRFPVAARAKYADDVKEQKHGDQAGIDIFAHEGAPVVAVNDGIVKKIGGSEKDGYFVVLQDVYGNQYTYSGLGSVSELYPVPKRDAGHVDAGATKVLGANDPTPTGPASAGSQHPTAPASGHARRSAPRPPRRKVAKKVAAPAVAAVKKRLFAHPQRPNARANGGFEQILDSESSSRFETYDSYFTRPLGLNSKNAKLRRLKKGSRVVASTVLGRIGSGDKGKKAPHLHFEIRPAGRGAPNIDPKPILDGWKLLESTAIYRASGKNALYGDGDFSIGQAMLLPKPLLAKRVLSDPRIEIYPQGREDIKTGQIDRRVLVVLEYLADSGMHPTVSCLRAGHSFLTASGNVSEHSSGNAVDISAINGVPILGHQGSGDVTERAVRRLMLLQGTLAPHQIISLLDFGQNTLALSDHANHIHVGFHPLYGANDKLGRQAQSVLKPGQWENLVQRLGEIQNPTVPTKPSRYAIPDRKSDGGE